MLFTPLGQAQQSYRFNFSNEAEWRVVKRLLSLLEESSTTLCDAPGECRRVREGDAVVFIYFPRSYLSLSPGENGTVYIGGLPGGGYKKEENTTLAAFLEHGWQQLRGILHDVDEN